MTAATITPNSVLSNDSGALHIPHTEGVTKKLVQDALAIPGESSMCAAWNGHEFELSPFHVYDGPENGNWVVSLLAWDYDTSTPLGLVEFYVKVYYPIDPRTNAKDWRRATRAYLNETKTAWLPEHCDADHMHDREVEIVAVLRSVFTPQIEELDRAWKITPATKPNGWPLGTPFESQAVKFLKWDTLRTFREEAVKCAIEGSRDRYIGWYHQNPQLSHVHNIAHDCITTTLANAPANKYALVAGEIRNAAVSLALHTYERRWERDARLKAEAAAREAATESADDSGTSD